MNRSTLLACAATLVLAGCETTPPVESDYGQSVAQLARYQVYDRTTLNQPSTKPDTGGDPGMLNVAIESLRAPLPPRNGSQSKAPTLSVTVGGTGQQ